MFILEREEILGKNELYISNVLDILEQKHKCSFLGEEQGIVTVKSEEKNESFSAVVNEDTIGIIKINEKPCKLFIKLKEDSGQLINKDLGLKFSYSIESLENDIEKISILQNMDNNFFFQSYLYKNDDAIIIAYSEKMDKENILKTQKEPRDFIITIENNNIMNVSEEELQEYASKLKLGAAHENIDGKHNSDNIEDYEDEEDYKEDIEDEEEYEEYPDIEDYEEDMEDDDEIFKEDEYENIIVKENGEIIDKKSTEEMIDDVYDELLQSDIYINESTIAEIENIFLQVQELFKLKEKPNPNKEEFNR